MGQRKIAWAALAVLGLGVFAPGCRGEEPDQDIDWRGSLCAASANGGTHCVPSAEGPVGAWDQAAAGGDRLIEMWAERPGDLPLDELVSSKDLLKAWFTDIDTVLSYVRDKKQSAESYRASLAGHLGMLVKEARDQQAAILAQKPVDAIGNFKKAVSDKASAEKSPRLASLADDKQAMRAVQANFDKNKSDTAPLKEQFASVVAQFTSYRATEAAETTAYAALAQQASAAPFGALDGMEEAILAAAKAASSKPNDLAQSAMKLSAQIQQFEVATQASFEVFTPLPNVELTPGAGTVTSYAEFAAAHGLALPDMTSSALRSLNAMLAYAQKRVARSDATAIALLNGVAMRRQALALLNAGQPVRDMIAQAKLLKAGATFQDASSARMTALGQTPPISASMKLPYLARRYDELTALVQMEPLCDPASSSWREAGCSSLRGNFNAAETYLKTTLPALIQAGLGTMRAKGVDAALLDAAQAKLDAGDVKGAAIVYDAAVRSSEGT